ncbi:hypothetical protein EPN90_03880 [Patescibacteria group bacterium]|nr:MAG: hypothetical protein EPN90_03880 [Patescibacteria group bacterium]
MTPITPKTPIKKNELVLLIIILVATLGGLAISFSLSRDVAKRLAGAKEAAEPVKLNVIKITANCPECLDIAAALNDLKKQPIALSEEKEISFDSPEGRELTSSLGIEKIPAYIVRGDIKNKKLAAFFEANGKIVGDSFVFEKVQPVFVTPQSGEKHGQLAALVLYSAVQCPACTDPAPLLEQFKAGGISASSSTTRTVDPRGAEGQTLVKNYRITSLPTILLQGETKLYEQLVSARFGTIEPDGTFVFRAVSPPYFDAEKNRVAGVVELISLVDGSCKECYDVGQHELILKGTFGVKIGSSKIIDASSAAGKRLIKQYSIAAVPTVIISPDLSAYDQLVSIWPQVGTAEKDGWYVFRELKALGGVAYKDLAANIVVNPVKAAGNATSTVK